MRLINKKKKPRIIARKELLKRCGRRFPLGPGGELLPRAAQLGAINRIFHWQMAIALGGCLGPSPAARHRPLPPATAPGGL